VLHLDNLARTILDDADAPLAAWRTTEFWDAARAGGVLPLAYDRVARAGWAGFDPALRQRIQGEAAAQAARSALAAADLRRVLEALHAHSVMPVIIKGAGLAHTVYRRPDLRPCLDADLLIPAGAIDAAHDVFRTLDAEYLPHVTGTYVMSQFHYLTTDAVGNRHVYDVHWRVVNRLAFAGALSYEEAAADAEPLTPLGPFARALSPVHALLIACVHRAAHHAGDDRVIWLVDIHLLANALSERQQDAFVALVGARGLSGIACAALRMTEATLDCDASRRLVGRLAATAMNDGGLASTYLRTDRTRAVDAFNDVRALRGWRARARLLGELACPPRAYMREVYAPNSRAPLVALYLGRLVAGLWRGRNPR